MTRGTDEKGRAAAPSKADSARLTVSGVKHARCPADVPGCVCDVRGRVPVFDFIVTQLVTQHFAPNSAHEPLRASLTLARTLLDNGERAGQCARCLLRSCIKHSGP
jgi:hypothetical protein